VKPTASLLAVLLVMGIAPPAAADKKKKEPKKPKPNVQELTLKSAVFGNTRQIRVLVPPGYEKDAAARFPVFYFFDGIAAFDAWGVTETVPALWEKGELPEMLFVGVDNGGSTRESRSPVVDRASEYLPYPDPSWTTVPRPTPSGEKLPAFLDEVKALVASRFRTKDEPGSAGIAGYSFSGVAALYMALQRPSQFGYVLIESPSLHVGDGRLIADAIAAPALPGAICLGVGTAEGEERSTQEEMLANVRALYAGLEKRPGLRAKIVITPEADHGYTAWHQRLPGALKFLLRPE
jgi:predicted alpha/beta superfamily hydrolase